MDRRTNFLSFLLMSELIPNWREWFAEFNGNHRSDRVLANNTTEQVWITPHQHDTWELYSKHGRLLENTINTCDSCETPERVDMFRKYALCLISNQWLR